MGIESVINAMNTNVSSQKRFKSAGMEKQYVGSIKKISKFGKPKKRKRKCKK
tara:strand:- start:4201 stop:4356 length:156 start_codon:yes stop_codon:yes gene_type:complete